ncbi:MAG: helix-turn-helix domain-containing protein [Firmicutes bacterium]|nr:helix-turn-helix domain-containing protein [Bacillota bacterium]
MNIPFGERLKELRQERNLSTTELGEIIGVTNGTVSRWENNKTEIISQHIITLAKFFEVTTDYLLGLTDY